MLPDLGATHALLLQGPAGPFMRRFADELRRAGIAATKVNFHAGEALYFGGPNAVAFRGRPEEWPAFLRALMEERGIDALFVFGDCRPIHRAAIEVARAHGARVWVFEEGYLRPDWITLEEDGVNGYSRMPRDPDFYRRMHASGELADPEPSGAVGPSFHFTSWYSMLSALAFTHLNDGFPHYTHHRELNAWYHTGAWVRDFFRKRWIRAIERPALERLRGPLSKRYYFVPMQVYCDFQIVHSPYSHVLEFVREVVERFAACADPDHSLVIKHHPMDRAYCDYRHELRALAQEYGLNDRLIYVHDLHLPTLLRHAIGTITINSTVGLQSIEYGTPVKVMGTAVYDMPGLSFQGSLDEFFDRPGAIDRALYEAYRLWLLNTNQVNGSFYKRLPDVPTPTGVRWFHGLVPRARAADAA